MNPKIRIISLILFLICINNLISFSESQQAICAYEINIDYYLTSNITCLFAKAPHYCCDLCGLESACIGKAILTI